MHEITSYQIHQLMKRLPHIEHSYETQPHKKVSTDYNACVAIPVGRKCLLWFTFYGDKNVCFIIELNRDKKAARISVTTETHVSTELAKGTIMHGTLLDSTIHSTPVPVFLVDDIFYYCGIPTRNLMLAEKLGFLDAFFAKHASTLTPITEFHVSLALIWPVAHATSGTQSKPCEFECKYEIPQKWTADAHYTVHHVQYRCLHAAMPYYNVQPSRKIGCGPSSFGASVGYVAPVSEKQSVLLMRPKMSPGVRMDTHKSQYRYPTVFIVRADLQYDVYHLFAYGRDKSLVYCDVGYVPNYEASVYLNGVFRKIRENRDLDAIEESDDEDDFQNVAMDKYVDLTKQVQMECRFNLKFKKWEPVKALQGSHKVVHISQLASSW